MFQTKKSCFLILSQSVAIPFVVHRQEMVGLQSNINYLTDKLDSSLGMQKGKFSVPFKRIISV